MTPKESCGVVYIATGRRHLDEMLVSARSLRRHMPDLPIVLFTDQSDLPQGVFSEIRPVENPHHSFIDKIAPLRGTPFDRTVFLDTDTFVCAPVPDLFDILDRFELAVSRAPLRHDRSFVTPNCFTELNTGVMAYRRTENVDALFAEWLRLYEKEVRETGRMDSDQPAFREALYRSPVPFYVLPQEYNLRTVMPAAVGRCEVKIVHGRAADIAEVARWANESRSIRLFLPSALQMTRRHFSVLSRRGRIVTTLLDLCVTPFVITERALRFVKRKVLRLE